MASSTLTSILDLGNLILASANVIIAFSLLAYLLTHNFRSSVARAVMALLAFVSVVYASDVIMANVSTTVAALLWLRVQWLGIAFVPAAYLQLSEALLRTTGSVSRGRRIAVLLSYGVSLASFILAISTDAMVYDGVRSEWFAHLAPGPLFWAFALFFALTTAFGLRNIRRARRRCLTSTSRRRMTYLGVASAAPVMGVFPYLLIATTARVLSPNGILFLALVGNLGVALMTVVMGYAVAYHGVLTPDRVIKHSMIHYLLRGPVVGIGILSLMLIIPRVEQILGVPRDTVLIFTVIISLVLFQVTINVAKPYIDRLIYRKDREELAWIQTLDQRLFTTTDLEQLLENVLATLCDFLQVRTGFVVVIEDHQLAIRVFCGLRSSAERFLSQCDMGKVVKLFAARHGAGERDRILKPEDFVLYNGYRLLPLCTREGQGVLGIMGIEARDKQLGLSQEEIKVVARLVGQAERALEDTRLQQEIFDTLRRLGPEIEALQRLRGMSRYARPNQVTLLEADPIHEPSFQQWVKDALSHYWGGPRLNKSPLLQLKLVQQELAANEGVPAKALRAVLQKAMERLKPSGERHYTAAEWLIYNILDLRFVKGAKTRDVAQRLAMSESDFYRKQRVAIAEVSRILADMEREKLELEIERAS